MKFLGLCAFVCGTMQCIAATVFYHSGDGGLAGVPVPDRTAAGALNLLSEPPPGYGSALPLGTRVLGFHSNKGETTIEFSPEVLSGLDDARLEDIFYQVRATLESAGISGGIRLQCGGRLLADYLAPKPVIAPQVNKAQALGTGVEWAPGSALAGKSVSLSPGHGLYWNSSGYVTERPVYCSPLLCEDDHNVEIMTYLNQYLTQDGAVTKVYRCLNKSYGTYSGSGQPWWRMSAGYWLQLNGYPCSVYASSTGDCNLGTGLSESGDSLRSRGLASDYDNTTIYVSLHSNGFKGNCFGSTCPNGTCTYYDTSTEHASWGLISSNLAKRVNNAIVSAIRTKYTDSTWTDRGAIDSAGDFAETRIPDRAAILIELAFHDSCDRDGAYLRDNFFRSTTMWASYKGICDYFGITPGWDYYSYEIVSDDFPATMQPGASAVAHVTLRNRGVLWNDTKLFGLGAAGDSDPFSTTTRYNVGAEIGPGQTKTFTITLKAPTGQGTYTSDWRMIREGVTWFGPTLTRNILVSTNGDTQPPTAPSGLVATAVAFNQVNLVWRPATDNLGVSYYRIYRNSALIGTSATTNYSDTTCASMTTYQYQVSAVDTSTNEGSRSAAAPVTTPARLDFIIDNPQGVAVGSWTTGTSSTDKYLDDYRWANTSTSETATFRWTPRIEQPGFYNVYAWYPQGSNRCTNSPYRIVFAGGSAVRLVNQTSGGGAWVSLGPVRPFISGTNGYIQVGNQAVDTTKVVMADAVRFTYSSALPAIPNLQARANGSGLVLSWSNGYCVLQETGSLDDPVWTDVPGATSPYPVTAGAGQSRFYRLRY